jgi:hypothetical protein
VLCSELACLLTWIRGKVLRSRGLCGASCSPRTNDARGRTATTPIRPPAQCSSTGLICDKVHVREKSVDRRGVGRSPRRDSSGCTARRQPRRRSKRGARRWQTTPARDPPHWGVCVAFVLSQRASRRRSCEIPSRLGRDPAAVEQLRRASFRRFLQTARGEPKRGGPLPSRRASTPGSHRGDAEPALAATAIAYGASRLAYYGAVVPSRNTELLVPTNWPPRNPDIGPCES